MFIDRNAQEEAKKAAAKRSEAALFERYYGEEIVVVDGPDVGATGVVYDVRVWWYQETDDPWGPWDWTIGVHLCDKDGRKWSEEARNIQLS